MNKTNWWNLCCQDTKLFSVKFFNYPNWFPLIETLPKVKVYIKQENNNPNTFSEEDIKLNPINVNCLACGG